MASPHLPWGLPRTSGHPGPASPQGSAGSGLAQHRHLLQQAVTCHPAVLLASEGQVLAWVGLELPTGFLGRWGGGLTAWQSVGPARGGDWLQASARREAGQAGQGLGASAARDPTWPLRGVTPGPGPLLRGASLDPRHLAAPLSSTSLPYRRRACQLTRPGRAAACRPRASQ